MYYQTLESPALAMSDRPMIRHWQRRRVVITYPFISLTF